MGKIIKFSFFLIIFGFSIKAATGESTKRKFKLQEKVQINLKVQKYDLGIRYIVRFSTKNNHIFEIISRESNVSK